MGKGCGDILSLLKNKMTYHLRVLQLQALRQTKNMMDRKTFAKKQTDMILEHTVKRHQSLLRRKLGATDPQLQENKIVNLRNAIETMDGLLIKPGEVFSFWRLVGKPTVRKGYINGLLLSHGRAITGVGGGLCQLANLLYWMALHTPLEIVERHHHSFDPFPDEHRTLPFGSGASVFYNYIDLRFYNPTNVTFQLKLWLTDKHLKGAIHSDSILGETYHIEERNHHFLQKDGLNFRENEIWRKVHDRQTGNILKEEFLIHNFAEVKYSLKDFAR
jgi:vancomycin resistance protein VanW